MAVSLTVNGVTFEFPETGAEEWGDDVTDWATAVSQHLLQKTGGSFSLTNDVDFGSSKGLIAPYFTSKAATPAAAGVLRLGNTQSVSWRVAAGSSDKALAVSASDRLQFDSVNIPTISSTDTLTNKTLTAPVISTILNTGTLTLPTATTTLVGRDTTDTLTNKTFDADGTGNSITNIENADIKVGAAIARTKLASGTASHVLINDGSGVMSSEATLAKSRGGAGADMSSVTFPSSGTIATTFASSQVVCDSANGHGAVATKIRRWTNSTTTGTDITYADSANNGATFTINTAGLYAISYADGKATPSLNAGISLNSANLTTDVQSLTAAERLIMVADSATPAFGTVSTIVRLAATDVIRCHTDGNPDRTQSFTQFRIVRIG